MRVNILAIFVVANGSYRAFQKLGNYYGVGNLLMVIYAVCNAIGQFFTLVVPIDAPLRMLLGDENARRFVPKGLLKQNDKGAYINGIKMVVVLSGSIILAQIVVPGAATVLAQLNKLNSVCMPLRYIWCSLPASCSRRRATALARSTSSPRARSWAPGACS